MNSDPPHAAAGAGLRRQLGPVRGMALSLGVVIGSGIFVFPAYVAGLLPQAPWFLAAWVVGAFLSLCTALSYAELATVFPRTGGYVVYLREVYGDRVAFVYGWAAMSILYPSSIAGLARVSGRFLTMLRLLRRATLRVVAAVVLGVAVVLNVLGVSLSSRVQVGLSGTKLAALLILGLAGLLVSLFRGDAVPDAAVVAAAPAEVTFGLGVCFLALVGVLWCYEGFLEIVVVAGETTRPARTLTGVLVGTVLSIGVIYLIYTLALMRVLGLPAMAQSSAVAADLAAALVGEGGRVAVDVLVVVATLSATISLLFSAPRILVAMSRAGLFPALGSRVSSDRGTPGAAVILCGLAALAYALVGTFEELVKYFSFATGLFSSLILAGGMWLRARGRVAAASRRIPMWPLPPVLSILASLGGVVYVLRDQPRSSLVGLAILLVALPFAPRVRGGRPGRPDPTAR